MRLDIPKKLAVVGDSGVFGWGDVEEGGWCERLRRHWMALPGGPVLYNLGVRGDGLERVAARVCAEVGVRGELRRQSPQGILLAVGLNDTARIGRPDGRPQLAPEAFLFGVHQLLKEVQHLAPVFVLGLTPVLEEAMPFADLLWYSTADVHRYEGLLEEACMEANVPFLPVLASFLEQPGWQDWFIADGLHCNSAGHAFLYQRVKGWSALLAWAGLHPGEMATPLAY